jgi:hypothetical protein
MNAIATRDIIQMKSNDIHALMLPRNTGLWLPFKGGRVSIRLRMPKV